MDIKAKLLLESEKDYKNFSASLIPNIDNVLGVRLPTLRKIAKDIYKNGEWKEFVNQQKCEFMEEVMLQGMVIGLIKAEPEKILEYVKNFVPKIDNWAVCDIFCGELKTAVKKGKETALNLQIRIKNWYGIFYNLILNPKKNMTFVLAM